MRVLITGGTGLIGKALAMELVGRGHDVTLLSRDPKKAIGLPDEVRIERWDAHTADGWASLVDGAGAIVNLSGENIAAGRWTPERKRRIRESRLNAGQAVVRAIETVPNKPGVVVQASGIGIYGDCGDEEVTEETPPGHDFLAQFAIEWEHSTSRLQNLGVRWLAIRTGVVLSSAGGALGRMILPRYFYARRFGSGLQWFPWIHIADEVGAISFLIENEAAYGSFNLSAPNPVTNAMFCERLGKELGRPVPIPIPSSLLSMFLGEMATALLYSQRAVPQRLLQMDFTFRFPGIDLALQDLLR
ncbi:MAG TPA: TIGR01777 family oxidoreductase [Dehalococcoidia bacterium]|nr:TIGR01777 family oxidoreductase [Dehalococcoidia bacterium]